MIPRLVIIKGAGDLASGVAHRLWRSGFNLVMLELPRPLVVRRTVSFATAVYEGSAVVESVEARLCPTVEKAPELIKKRIIPVLIDPRGDSLSFLQPKILVDAVMAKKNLGTCINNAELVIALGPGFTAGKDVHAVIETRRGHKLGCVIDRGTADADTGEPGEIAGFAMERLLRAPADGIFKPHKMIGDTVIKGETVALVDRNPVYTQIDGLVRGLLYPGLQVKKGMKVGDIDPRGETVDFCSISDKARAVGGGVLEAILNHYFKPV